MKAKVKLKKYQIKYSLSFLLPPNQLSSLLSPLSPPYRKSLFNPTLSNKKEKEKKENQGTGFKLTHNSCTAYIQPYFTGIKLEIHLNTHLKIHCSKL